MRSTVLSAICSLALLNLDECQLSEYRSVCRKRKQSCQNTMGSIKCICLSGYTGELCGVEINECLEEHSSLCGLGGMCENTTGSFRCWCLPGYRETSKNQCMDVNECNQTTQSNPCGPAPNKCLNTPGSYLCQCASGFQNESKRCVDINECNDNIFHCGINGRCENTNGSFTCHCSHGFHFYEGICHDINECRVNSNRCGKGGFCQNSIGSFSCNCTGGYELLKGICLDINECKETSSLCGAGGICNNTVGSYQCVCRLGYVLTNGSCIDFNECEETQSVTVCNYPNVCTNTDGSFQCSPNCSSPGASATNPSCTTTEPQTGRMSISTLKSTSENFKWTSNPESQTSLTSGTLPQVQQSKIATRMAQTEIPSAENLSSPVVNGSNMASDNLLTKAMTVLSPEHERPTTATGEDDTTWAVGLVVGIASLTAIFFMVIIFLLLRRRKKVLTVSVRNQFSMRRRDMPFQSVIFEERGAAQQRTRQDGGANAKDISPYIELCLHSQKLAVAAAVSVSCEEYYEPLPGIDNNNFGQDSMAAEMKKVLQAFSEKDGLPLGQIGTSCVEREGYDDPLGSHADSSQTTNRTSEKMCALQRFLATTKEGYLEPIDGAQEGQLYDTCLDSQNGWPQPSTMAAEKVCKSGACLYPYDTPLSDVKQGNRCGGLNTHANNLNYDKLEAEEDTIEYEQVVADNTVEGADASDYHQLTHQVGKSQIYEEPPTRVDDLYSHLRRKAIVHLRLNEVRLKKSIGSGEFGLVYKGVLKQGKKVPVAVKVLCDDGKNTKQARQSLLQEAAILHQFHHPNILKLLGIVDNPVMLVTELLEKGDLLGYLKSLQPDPGQIVDSGLPGQLLKMCQEISSGMFYLSSLGFIHRDIAARNILLDSKLTCKISDFGMSRQLNMADYYRSRGGKIPLRWTAPEALLYQKYTSSSDVWSFGVTLYETWTLGQLPFSGIDNAEVISLVTEQRQRLPPPPGCSRALYEIMIQCWHPEPNGRLSFKMINMKLNTNPKKLLEVGKKDGVLGSALTAFADRFNDLRDKYC